VHPQTALPDEFLARFRTVALERLERLEAGWLQLTQSGDEGNLAANMRRDLHTLKGDSRVVGFGDVNLLCHKLEDLLTLAQLRSYQVPEDFDLVVTMAIHFIAMLLRKRVGQTVGGIDLAGFVQQMDDVLREAQAQKPQPIRPPSRPPSVLASLRADRLSRRTRHYLAAAATTVWLEHAVASGRSRDRLRDVWLALTETLSVLDSEPLAPRLARHVHTARQLARDLGKQIDVALDADELTVHAEIADALDTALLHALRNAVDHGIEDPASRRAAGKPPAGQIRIRVRAGAERVELAIEDDGRGVDLVQVRRRAGEMRLLPPHGGELSEAGLLEILFQPGFSTKSRVSEVSGRGIGLDAARAALAAEGGTIELHSSAGRGTTVVLRAPHSGRHLPVHRFDATRGGLVLAAPAEWSVTLEGDSAAAGAGAGASASASAFDPVVLLLAPGTPSEAGGRAPITLRLSKGGRVVQVRAGGAPTPETAERLCATSDDHPAEVVSIAGVEALLLHPDVLPRKS